MGRVGPENELRHFLPRVIEPSHLPIRGISNYLPGVVRSRVSVPVSWSLRRIEGRGDGSNSHLGTGDSHVDSFFDSIDRSTFEMRIDGCCLMDGPRCTERWRSRSWREKVRFTRRTGLGLECPPWAIQNSCGRASPIRVSVSSLLGPTCKTPAPCQPRQFAPSLHLHLHFTVPSSRAGLPQADIDLELADFPSSSNGKASRSPLKAACQ